MRLFNCQIKASKSYLSFTPLLLLTPLRAGISGARKAIANTGGANTRRKVNTRLSFHRKDSLGNGFLYPRNCASSQESILGAPEEWNATDAAVDYWRKS